MVIKKYIANNMNEAMTRIRHELGRDAVIISHRKIKRPGIKGLFKGKQIEVTAAIENYSKDEKDVNMQDSIKNMQNFISKEFMNKKKEDKVITESIATNNTDNKVINQEQQNIENEMKTMKELLNEVIKNTTKEKPKEDELITILKDLDIDSDFYDEFNEKVNRDNLEDSLREYIKNSIEISTEELRGKVVLVGPTGVGKTTTIAKLAGRLALVEKKKVGLITIDTYRIGAVEQLKTYAEIMNIDFKVVITTKEMETAIENMKECDVILIDTTGRSSKNSMQISELRAFVERAKPDSISVVISATTKNRDIKTILDGYRELNYDKVIITKLDETTTYGSLYNIEKRAEKPLKFITIGQNVPDDIKEPTKDDIVKFIFGEEALC